MTRAAKLAAALTLAVLLSTIAAVPSGQASDSRHTFIRNFPASPKALSWTTSDLRGTSREIHWRHWGAPNAVGLGATRVCPTGAAAAPCSPLRSARIHVSERRSFTGPEGGDYYIYCRVMVRGHLDPGNQQRTIAVVTQQDQEYPCG
jgi:hypothetical protein